jgi:hypothetical protein
MSLGDRLAHAWALVLVLSAARAEPAPMFTDLATIRGQLRDVVIGTVHRSEAGLTIDVDTVVRGAVSPGRALVLNEAPHERVRVDGERVLAFIDADGQLRWVGQLLVGESIEAGVLSVHGFFDSNEHLVEPGIATLAQLTALLSTGALVQRFAGTLAFPDERGVLRASSSHLRFEYDPVTHRGAALGAGPPCLETSEVHLEWGRVLVSFTDSCPRGNRVRRLRLVARVTGVDAASGELQVELTPIEPLVSATDYARFVADGSMASVTRVISVRLADGSAWQWRVGEGLVDPSGRLRPTGSFSSGVLSSGASVEATSFADARLSFSPSPSDSGLSSDAALILAVQRGSITWCRFARAGQAAQACTLTLAPSIWLKR